MGSPFRTVTPPPLVGSIRWDGWTQDAALQASFGVAASVYTTYASRKPANWGGDAATVGGGGWAMMTTDSVNHPVDTAAIVDLEIADAKGALDFFVYLIYPDSRFGQTSIASPINQTYDAHSVSAHKGDVKRCIMLEATNLANPGLITDASWAHISDYATWLTGQFADPSYMRIDGKPVIGFFRPIQFAGDGNGGNANTLANYQALIALLPACYKMGFGEMLQSSGAKLGLDAYTVYDTAAGAQLSPNGQHAWADQAAKDLLNAALYGVQVCGTVSIRADDRPRLGEAGWSWTDPPTPQQQIDAINALGPYKIIMLSPATEVDEAGPLVRTVQDGDRYYDVTRWQRGLARPGSYTYEIDVRTLLCGRTGTWTRATGIAGAYDGDELSSANVNDTRTLTCDRLVLMRGTTGTIVVTGPTGAGLGTFDTLINGVSQGTTSQVGSTAHRVALKSVSVNLGDVVTIKVVSGPVTIDTYRATVTP